MLRWLRTLRDRYQTVNTYCSKLYGTSDGNYSQPACGSALDDNNNYFGSVPLNPETLARIATSARTWDEIMSFHSLLATDRYVQYVHKYYEECRERFKECWWYFDLINVLYAAAKICLPKSYLEIGVRRGRSVCTVVRAHSQVNIVAFDMWVENYAGIENPGATYVMEELRRHGHTGQATFIDGDSHKTVPAYFRQNPKATFDLITVDGDHTEEGAYLDLCNVIPHLSVGGVVVFDDIAHPLHPYLLKVWERAIKRFPGLSSYSFSDSGYGVAFAIRRK
jgi:predicted O-methyltransferase YrrM